MNNIIGFSLGVGLGALLALLVSAVWRTAHDKYQEINWAIEEWRRIQENMERRRRGLPPKPSPIEMGLSEADERRKQKTVDEIRRKYGPAPEVLDGFYYHQ